MKLYAQTDDYTIYNDNMLNMLDDIAQCSIDAVVCDPPYELGSMGKKWDSTGIAFQADTWKKCYEVLKPGGYLLAFGGSRTFHRIACAIEDAGFEIRDTISWLYGVGFPKSMNLAKAIEGKLTIGSANPKDQHKLNGKKATKGDWGYGKLQKEQGYRDKNPDTQSESEQRLETLEPTTEQAKKWQGWGTSLKPAYEPVIMARKPCEGSCTDNVLKYGVGGINVDECRIGDEVVGTNTMSDFSYTGQKQKELGNRSGLSFGQVENAPRISNKKVKGRFPSNVILTYNKDTYKEVCGGMPATGKSGGNRKLGDKGYWFDDKGKRSTHAMAQGYEDKGSAARYFYCAKATKKDRDEGLEEFVEQQISDGCIRSNSKTAQAFCCNPAPKKNIHATVKPTTLMQYLVRLVSPKGATILDPFMGSGSTGKAVMYENQERNAGYKFVGIELTDEYLPIAHARIEHVRKKETQTKWV